MCCEGAGCDPDRYTGHPGTMDIEPATSTETVLQSKRTYDEKTNAATEHVRNQSAVLI